MKKIDSDFFDEYKKLDSMCGNLLSCKNGVSEYISRMERCSGTSRIPTWNDDYKKLKHLRWIRNQIAHDSTNKAISSSTDLSDVKQFQKRIQKKSDPLTALGKTSGRHTKRRKKSVIPTLVFLFIIAVFFIVLSGYITK